MDGDKLCPNCKAVNSLKMRFCGECGSQLEEKIHKELEGDPLLGSLVGNRFIVMEKIAQGGMGVVYKAEQTGIWRTVALKVLRPRFHDDNTLLVRFRNEASTASRLSHPNTITIYDFGVLEDHGLYLAMEFIEGHGLDAELKRFGWVDWRRACRIGGQICGSLQEAHDHNIVHRDLKPENIMLTHRGTDLEFVKVLDFGIAKIMAEETEDGRPSLTAKDQIFGTPDFMAPEQIRSEKLDRRVDIYSLGVIFYRMLTGKMPFVANSPVALLAKHLTEEPLPFSATKDCPKAPPALETLVMSCLAKNREDRPETMKSISDRLLALLKSSPSLSQVKSSAPDEPVAPVEESTKNAQSDGVVKDQEPEQVEQEDRSVEDRNPYDGQDKLEEEKPEEDEFEEDEFEQDEPEQEELSVDGEKKTKRERTLERILKKMKKDRDFPAMSKNISELSTKAGRTDTSARQLANVILRDYGLTSKLLKLVNSPFYGQYRGRVMTVSRAVVILGFEQVREIALGIILFEMQLNKDKHQNQALLDVTLSSLMSGLVAKGVAHEGGNIKDEEALVCTMLRRLGKYVSYYHLPVESKEIRRRVKKEKETEEDAARKVLGLSLVELGQIVAKEWDLPEKIQGAMKKLPKGKLPKARNESESLLYLAGFADELTQAAFESRPSGRKAALKNLSYRFKDNISLDDGRLEAITIDATREVRDYSKGLQLEALQSSFISRALQWSGATELPEPVAGRRPLVTEFPTLDGMEETPFLNKPPSMNQLKEGRQILESGSEEVALAMNGKYELNALIMMVLETMYRGVGLSRVIFCMNDVKSKRMIARSGFGDGVEEMIADFHFQTGKGQDLFNESVSRGMDVLVGNTSDPRYARRLPEWYRAIADPPIFLLYPVMIGRFSAGLFYGDILDKKKMINRKLLMHLSKLRNQIARALKEQRPSR